MKISVVFENADLADLAGKRISESGVNIRSRSINTLNGGNYDNHGLPTDHFYFPAASEFYTGMIHTPSMSTPASPFFPMAGNAFPRGYPYEGESRLEMEVEEEDYKKTRDLLIQMHGSDIQSYQ